LYRYSTNRNYYKGTILVLLTYYFHTAGKGTE
jgi:hypothetical protein